MSYTLDTFEVGPLTVRIEAEDYPESPREWDNLGVMVCGHDRYNLGDETFSRYWDETYDTAEAYLVAEYDALPETILPLYLLDHSGLSMSTGSFGDPWDSGQVGFIFATAATVEACGTPPELIGEALRGEVATYDQYLRGDVWRYVVEDASGQYVDSCHGYYDTEDAQSDGRSEAEATPAYHRWAVGTAAQLAGIGL